MSSTSLSGTRLRTIATSAARRSGPMGVDESEDMACTPRRRAGLEECDTAFCDAQPAVAKSYIHTHAPSPFRRTSSRAVDEHRDRSYVRFRLRSAHGEEEGLAREQP